MADVECDAIVCDPPYGKRTHESKPTRRDEYEVRGNGYDVSGLTPSYAHWEESDVCAFVTSWSERCRGWIIAMTSHDLVPAWERAFAYVGRYAFHPLPLVMRGMSVRLCGDGPSSWAVWALCAMVARPSTGEYAKWGTMPGAYHGPSGTESAGGRGKPDWLMSAIVRDYSKPGDVVCDPFAGWGSTLAAAVGNGRTAIGADVDDDAVTEAARRLRRGTQSDMFGALT